MKEFLDNLVSSQYFEIIAVLSGILIYKITSSIRLRNKVKLFLYNNGYVSIDFKTKKDIYPKVSFLKNYISVKKSFKKSSNEILTDKTLWEESFSKEIAQKKIVEIVFQKNEIRLMLL